jgi:hydroxyacylglutathione hydrolase
LAVGATIPFSGHSIAVLHTPGHSPGGVCYRLGKQLITGDTVFVDGCGRADLPHSDVEQLYMSLFETLWPLPDDTVIYPGHDYGPTPTDTWGNQKKTNRFLQSETREVFLRKRKG